MKTTNESRLTVAKLETPVKTRRFATEMKLDCDDQKKMTTTLRVPMTAKTG
jgi:hypothetical protein